MIVFFVFSLENKICIVFFVENILFGFKLVFFDLVYILNRICVKWLYDKDFVVFCFLNRVWNCLKYKGVLYKYGGIFLCLLIFKIICLVVINITFFLMNINGMFFN